MTASTAEPVVSPRSKPPAVYFWCGFALLVCWMALIGWLTITRSNPVTLNPRQLSDSDVIVVGRVVSTGTANSTSGIVEPAPDQPWPLPGSDSIRIINLAETGAQVGEIYLLPLVHMKSHAEKSSSQTDFAVTPTQLPDGESLIYRASPEAFRQYKEIVSGEHFHNP